jgi:PKD repeat protein
MLKQTVFMNLSSTKFLFAKPATALFSAVCFLTLLAQPLAAQHCHAGFHIALDGSTVAFENLSTADGIVTGYSWDFGDGETSTEQNPTHTYAQAGTYNVCVTVTAQDPDCSSTFCHHVVVAAPPSSCHAAFASHQPHLAEPTMAFTDQSTGTGALGSWLWDFGDGSTSTEQNPVHAYTVPGTYTVCLMITTADGLCTHHVCHTITVHHPPAAVCDAAYAAHQGDLDEPVIAFTDQSNSSGAIGTWLWEFGDGTTSTEQNPVHTYTLAGTYAVCLTITSADGSCTDHFCQDVVVHHPVTPVCHAGFSFQSDGSGMVVHFNNSSTGTTATTQYTWQFGDGTTSHEHSPVYTYSHTGHYTVCLFIEDAATGCSSHSCHTVTIHHPTHHPVQPTHHATAQLAAPAAVLERSEKSKQPLLLATYPNPATDQVRLNFELEAPADVAFELWNATGLRVLQRAARKIDAGKQIEVIETRDFPAGSYLIMVVVDGIPSVSPVIIQH